MGSKNDTVLVSGHAKFPEESAAKSRYSILTITVELNVDNWEIISVDTTLVTETAQNFIRKKLISKRIFEEGKQIAGDLDRMYQGYAKKTVLAAFYDLLKRTEEVAKSNFMESATS